MRSSLLVSFLFSSLMACGVDDPETAGPGTKLTSAEIEPNGAHCAAGGVALHTGLDADENGILDPNEITSTTYVCSHKTLVREDNVGSGPVCPGGGVAVRTGHDLNDNSTLENSEIETTTTVCYSDELFHGDLKTSSFTTELAKTKLSHVRVVNGNVIIDSDVALPNLTTIAGNMDVRVPSLVELPSLDRIAGNLTGAGGIQLTAPVLANIGGYVRVTSSSDGGGFVAPSLTAVDGEMMLSGKITSLDLRALDHVGGRLDLDVQPEALKLPALKSVAGSVIISGWFKDLDMHALETTFGFELVYSSLTSLSLPALKTASVIRIGNSSALAMVDMPVVAGVKTLTLYGLPKLTGFELPLITAPETLSVSGMATTDLALFSSLQSVKNLKIAGNPKLVDLRGLEQLTTATTVMISDNAKLVDLTGLDELEKISGDITIKRNAALTSFAGLEHLTNVSGTITIAENAALPQAEIDAFMKRLGR